MGKRPTKPEGVQAKPRHKGSKGAVPALPKPPKLSELSRMSPTTDEMDILLEYYESGTSIVVAIIGQGLVEHELDRLIRLKLEIEEDNLWKGIVTDRGPLSSFYARILFARACSMIDDAARRNLDVIRNIRNAFAHSKIPVDFSHISVAEELKNISPLTELKGSTYEYLEPPALGEDDYELELFRNLVTNTYLYITDKIFSIYNNIIEDSKAKLEFLTNQERAMSPLMQYQLLHELNHQQGAPENQTDNPTRAAPSRNALADFLRSVDAHSKKGKPD